MEDGRSREVFSGCVQVDWGLCACRFDPSFVKVRSVSAPERSSAGNHLGTSHKIVHWLYDDLD